MTAKLYLDKRYQSELSPLKIAICHNQRTAYISLDVKLSPSQWNNDLQVVENHPNKKELNIYIRSRLSAVERELLILHEMGKTGGKSAIEIRDMVDSAINPEKVSKKEKESLFLYRLKRYASLKDKKKTIQTFEWTEKWLRLYDSKIDKRAFEDINHDYLKSLLSFCDLSVNSKAILLRNIRTVFNDAIDAGITECYPFRRLSIKTEKTRKKALTLEQLRILKNYDCNVWSAEYRDMFLLMFYLRGINAVDLFNTRLTQIVNGRLEYRRSKVGSLFSIKIEPEAWEIINKYKGKEYLLNVLERYSSYSDYLHHMNDALKKIGCRRDKHNHIIDEGLFPDLSSNWARHSWITAGINLGIPKEIMSRGAGHSFGVAVTEVYIDYDYSAVDKANRKIIDSVKK